MKKLIAHLGRVAGVALLLLAAGPSVMLRAAVTLSATVGDLPAGAGLEIFATVDGDPSAPGLEWLVWEDGAALPADDQFPIVGLGHGHVRFAPTPSDRLRTFILQAWRGTNRSELRTIRVGAAAPEPEAAGPRGGKRAKVEPPRAAGSTPPVPAALASPSGLASMPDDLLNVIAGYAGGDALAINRRCHRAVTQTLPSLRISGAITDEQFLALMRKYTAVRHLDFVYPSTLTPEGIMAGLACNLKLEALSLRGVEGFGPGHLIRLAGTHARLAELSDASGKAVTDEVLVTFGGRLTHLALTPPVTNPASDRGLQACTGLVSLEMAYADDWTGEHCPAGLKSLTVQGCRGFLGRNLAASLEFLSVSGCLAFRNPILPSSLRTFVSINNGLGSSRLSDFPHIPKSFVPN